MSMLAGEVFAINTPYSMVYHIIRADIIRAMSKMSARIICETIEQGKYYSTIPPF